MKTRIHDASSSAAGRISTIGLAFGLTVAAAGARAESLVVESWRPDDSQAWQDSIIPAFAKSHPGIDVVYQPTTPTEYDAALSTRLEGGTAGDLVICRPFDKSLELFEAGHLLALDKVVDLSHFPAFAKSPWQTDDGGSTFCLPVASVIHGFMYNKEAFQKLGLTEPRTVDEFHAALDAIKKEGSYVPLAIGTADQWETAQIGYHNVGPSYWKGEAGRLGLLDGTKKLTDPEFVEPWKELASWQPYLSSGYQSQKYPDSQNLFTLGRAAIYPTGSWEIGIFRAQADFDFAAFAPPLPKGQTDCYINDHPDFGIGINAKSKNIEAAKAFLTWAAGAEFAALHANAVPGFFPLADYPVKLDDPVAQSFIDWRSRCQSSFRMSFQRLSRGNPSLENQLWVVGAQVMNGTMTPEQAGATLEQGLASWYPPHK